MHQPFDTIILGGGIAGAATADVLTSRGQAVLLIDQFEPGHQEGSSHGDGRIFRLGYPSPTYVEMALHAQNAWTRLGSRAKTPLMQTTGAWECGPVGGEWITELETNFRHFKIPYERLTAAESSIRFPHFHLDANSEVVFHPDGGVLFATRAVEALWRLVRDGGGTTVTGEQIVGIEPSAELVTIRAASGLRWQAKRLVITAGGWSKPLLATLGVDLPLTVTQELAAYFKPRDGVSHAERYHLGAMPACSDYHQPNSFYILPQGEVAGLKVGWHQTGQPIVPGEPRFFDQDNLAAMQGFVRDRLPELDTQPTFMQTCLYTSTPDSDFILDAHPNFPHILIGTGFSGHGFKFGPMIGQILAALALNEPPPLAIAQFALDRF